ncbi:MAG: hypothetical protein HC919_02725, partial [Oscillatoriales cyanobacterium SM2_2_1]|nr:hypothetical protein [Oscillatoriales cyanobacterium SM2_2_1]
MPVNPAHTPPVKFLGSRFLPPELLAMLLLVAALGTAATVTYGSDQNTRRIEQTYRQFLRTRRTLAAVRRVLSLTKDVQTGKRGFLLTGKEGYLMPYYDGLQALRKQSEVVQERLAEHPDLLSRFMRIKQLIADKVELVQETIQLKRDRNFDVALQLASSDRSKDLMREVRVVSAQIDFELEQKTLTLNDAAQEQNRLARQINLLGGVTTMVLGVAITAILWLKIGSFTSGKRPSARATSAWLPAKKQAKICFISLPTN